MPRTLTTWRCELQHAQQHGQQAQQQQPVILWPRPRRCLRRQLAQRSLRLCANSVGTSTGAAAWHRRSDHGARQRAGPLHAAAGDGATPPSELSNKLRKLMGLPIRSVDGMDMGPGIGPDGVQSKAPEDWGTSAWEQDWDPAENLAPQDLEVIADEAEEQFRGRGPFDTLRDKWITPLLDFQSVAGAVDLDQERTEENLAGEALANQDESQRALRYAAQLVGIPLVAGFIFSRALADPVLSFTLQNNEDAFAMTDRQKIEGAHAVHVEEARMRMDAAIGKAPPLTEEHLLEHLREFAAELEEEERHHNEQTLITIVSDSVSSFMLFGMLVQKSRGRQALFNTFSRLFEGLSDIAKAVMIILIADTLLGYHSEEGWTGLIELVAGHYGMEAEEEAMVIFVGVVSGLSAALDPAWGLHKQQFADSTLCLPQCQEVGCASCGILSCCNKQHEHVHETNSCPLCLLRPAGSCCDRCAVQVLDLCWPKQDQSWRCGHHQAGRHTLSTLACRVSIRLVC